MKPSERVEWFDRIPFANRETLLVLLGLIAVLIFILVVIGLLKQPSSFWEMLPGLILCPSLLLICLNYWLYTTDEKFQLHRCFNFPHYWSKCSEYDNWVEHFLPMVQARIKQKRAKIRSINQQFESQKLLHEADLELMEFYAQKYGYSV